MDKVLVLGHRGKLGRALMGAFALGYRVEGRSLSDGFDAGDPAQVRALLEAVRPRIVANAIARTGLDACERDPEAAFRLNTLLPGALARASRELGFLLVHFSSDAVFDGRKATGPYLESDRAQPLNIYGLTKLGGDCLVQAEAAEHYVFRLSVLVGEPDRGKQFLERMLAQARAGLPLRVANDIVCSPSCVRDVAEAVRGVLTAGRPHGLYHLANAGSTTLWGLVDVAVRALGLAIPVEPVAHTTFPTLARHALATPIASEILPPLRPWQEAVTACVQGLG